MLRTHLYEDLLKPGLPVLFKDLGVGLRAIDSFWVGLGCNYGKQVMGYYWDYKAQNTAILQAKQRIWEFLLHQLGSIGNIIIKNSY
ncbi:MAG: hypothetical protein NVS9B7_13480 [Flavisolibacter sp.]